jgi:hypothetical protein
MPRFTPIPEVMRYLRRRQAADTRRRMAKHGHDGAGTGRFEASACGRVEEKSTGAMVGRVGLYCPEGWPARRSGGPLAQRALGKRLRLRSRGGIARSRVPNASMAACDQLEPSRQSALDSPWRNASVSAFDREIELRGHPALLYSIERVRLAPRRELTREPRSRALSLNSAPARAAHPSDPRARPRDRDEPRVLREKPLLVGLPLRAGVGTPRRSRLIASRIVWARSTIPTPAWFHAGSRPPL